MVKAKFTLTYKSFLKVEDEMTIELSVIIKFIMLLCCVKYTVE